jgi:hypothetical protein
MFRVLTCGNNTTITSKQCLGATASGFNARLDGRYQVVNDFLGTSLQMVAPSFLALRLKRS